MLANPVVGQPSSDALRALLCQKLHVTSIRFSPSGMWPGGVTAANHAKLVFVDNQAFYIYSRLDAGSGPKPRSASCNST
ncbi:MAG TPA: hypothetical protein VIA18_03835 [Polyangia bacterium]|jgi:hypothetical protein|nr:hypothetical protein [Polyangia bacterium]